MSDIFGYNRSTSPDAVFNNDEAVLTISGTQAKGKLIQGWNVVYRQDVQEIFEIGSSNIYWVKGHPMGQGDLSRIVGGPSDDVKLFPGDAYDLCKGGVTFNIHMKPGVCEGQTAADVKLTMSGCVITQVGFSVAIQDVKINQGLQWRFASLSLD